MGEEGCLGSEEQKKAGLGQGSMGFNGGEGMDL